MAQSKKKITETGALDWRALKSENNKDFDSSKVLSEDEFNSLFDDGAPSVGSAMQGVKAYNTQWEGYQEQSPMSQQSEGQDYFGKSQYDQPIMDDADWYATQQNPNELRYENQPWYDTLANGVGKMLGTAGTTFVSSLVGLPYGIGAAINDGRWSALWDNDVTQGLADVDKWLENNMTNYRSQVQQNSPWYDPNNLFSMNFIADDVIKNMGFTLGAAASMAVGSGTLGLMSKALGKVNEVSNASKMTKNVMSALFSATGEGMIEARQGVDERNKLELQKLEDALQPEVEALRQEFNAVDAEYAANRGQELVQGADGKMYDPAYENYRQRMQELEAKKAELDRKKALGQQQIEESGREMGNKILLGNQVLLTAGNLIQFSKAMTKSYDKARHAAEQSAKVAKPSGVTATRVSNNLKDGYKISSPVPGRIKAATKGIVTEGSEEMNQQFIQSASGAAYNEIDANDYWRAKLDPESYRETTKGLYTMGQILDRGFQESWGDLDQWEQFVIGGLTGVMGSYSPTKLFNQDKSKSVWNPMRYGSWEGGAIKEIWGKEGFNAQYNQYQENIDALNKIMASEDFPARMSNLVGHTYTEKEKEYLAEQGDMKGWKDADDKQNIMDIQAFLRAGKLDDLRAIYQEMNGELSDDDIENIVKSTTREVTAEEDKQNFEKQADEQIAQHQTRISELQQKAQDIADQQETLEVGERGEYQVAVTPALEDIFADIDKEYDAISNLEQQKTDYTPQKYYEGAYVTREGNRTATNDEIRAEHKHNAEELNRKLDSYLESIDAVNKMTGGKLTKDQEDNLAYLHNMSKEKIVRFDKIMANVRKQLPNKFLIKTTKTPEQLAKENASSDLSFTVDDSTPNGYVEVDTSLMNDKAFGNFFMNTVMYGDNIMPEAEAAQEEEEKKTAKQEERERQAEKDREEQQRVNIERYKKNFYDTMRQGTNMTLDEIRDAFEEVRKDIYDASVLQNESQEFWNTYIDYMTNPAKVDEAKQKEETKVAEEQQKKDIQEMSARDLAQRTDLKELLAQAKTDSDIPLINKIKKAMLIRQQKAKTNSAGRDSNVLKDYSPQDKEMAIQAQLAKLNQELDRVDEGADENENTLQELADRVKGIDIQTVDDIILENLNPVEKRRMTELSKTDPEAYEKEMAERENTLLQALDELEKHTMQDLPDFDDTRVNPTDKDIRDFEGVVAEENPVKTAEPKRHDEVNPVISVPSFASEAPTKEDTEIDSISDSNALDEDMSANMNGVEFKSSGQHPWRATTRRVGYKTNDSYSQTLEKLVDEAQDPVQKRKYQKQLKRTKAVEKVLHDSGALTRIEQGNVSRGDDIKFAVSKAVNDEAEDFVIFMTDSEGRILADLPSSDVDIEANTNQIQGLSDIYEEARRQWDKLTDAEKDSPGLITLEGLQTKVDYTYFGKVKYQDERQSVNNLFGDDSFTLAIRVGEKGSSEPASFIDTGKKSLAGKVERKAIREPLTGAKGQPYVLIPTSKSKSNTYGEGYLAVPIATPTFGELGQDTQFYKVVRDILERIKDGKIENKQAKELLQVLFGVSNVHVNFDGDSSKKGSGITITTFSRANQNEKGNPHDIFKGNREDLDVDAALAELGNFFINISNKKINTSENFYTLSNGEKIDYNRMIGEIATTNAAAPHTVNDFFTVVPLEKKDGKFQQVAQKPPRMKFPQGDMNSVFNVKVQYKDETQRVWSISPSENFVCRDEQGRPIYKEDNIHTASEKKLAAQYRAEAFGRFYMKDFSQPFAVMLDNKAYLYDPANRTFKTVKELEKTAPRYDKNMSEYDMLEMMLESMEDARQQLGEAKAGVNHQKESTVPLNKFGSAITDYSYGAQDGLPTFYGTIPSTGERVRVEVNERNNRYDIWIDRALPGEVGYEPGKGINYNLILEGTEEEYNKVLKELGLPQEFIDALPKLHELNKNDVRNNTDTKDEYLEKEWGIKYGHNALNYKNINKVNDTIKKLQDDGDKYTVCDVNGKPDPEGDYYKDEDGLLHARVTSMAEGDPHVEPFKETLDGGTKNPWITPSTTIGNQVDEFIRVFFEGGDPMSISTPNLSKESKEALLEKLKEIQKKISGDGWKVASRNIVASGIISVTDANGDQIAVRVAGTLDLLLYNPEKDEYAIYDIKTHRSPIDFNNVDNDSHMGKWSAQLSLYKELLEAKYPELKGKIKGLKILPIKVDSNSYNADRHTYSKNGNTLVDESRNTVVVKFEYDGQTIPVKERSLKINMGKKGFKAAYNSEEGKKKIIISKPRPLPGEAEKHKVKEGILKSINKIAADRPVKRYLKEEFKNNPDALALSATIDEARQNGTLADLMLTEATMNMLSDMLNDKLIDNHAAQRKLNYEGLSIPGEASESDAAMPEIKGGEPEASSAEDAENKAKERKILDSSTERAWNRLTEENKKKVANAASITQVKKALQDAQKNPRKNPNNLITPYLHRKAVDTRGYKKLDMNKELEWLNKVLPQLSRLNKVKIIQGLIKCSDGTWDYGQLKNGLLYLGTNGKEGTVYHEAFHAVTQWVLTDKELDDLYEAAKERYGDLDTVTLEERLADDFMLYTMGVRPSYKAKPQSIFKRLWNAIKKMFGHTSMIDKLYQNINDGVYAGAVLRTDNNEFADITPEDREASMKYAFLDSEQRDRLNENNVSREQFEVLDANEKRYLFHCVI